MAPRNPRVAPTATDQQSSAPAGSPACAEGLSGAPAGAESDAFIVLDRDGRLVFLDAGGARLLGAASHQLVGKLAWDVLPASLQGRLRQEARTALEQGRPREVEEAHGSDGEWRSLTISPLADRVEIRIRDITRRRRAEALLRESEERFRLLVEGVADYAICMLDHQGNVTSWNSGAERIKGYKAEDILGQNFSCFYTPEDIAAGRPAESLWEAGQAGRFEEEGWCVRRDGSRFWAHTIVTSLRDEAGGSGGFCKVTRDVTAKREAARALDESREHLRQVQKMEAIGSLAGGIAHDFNNLLTAILSYTDLVLHDLPAGHRSRQDIEEIRKAGQRAAALTSQLLAFSRRQVMQPQVLDFNAVVADMERMLQRLIGVNIDVRTRLDPHLGRVLADPSQLEQVILNLAVNARDAMPDGGRLTLETANLTLDESYAGRHVAVRPGPYVLFAVSDTGSGMDRDTQARIFEPFFTTKARNKGTGLGLSTVYGIVKQSGGNIWVYSEPGAGTTFKVYLPRVDEPLPSPTTARAASPRGSETILLVEDDDLVREPAREILQRNGYTVLAARDLGEAVLLHEQHGSAIDLLITDLVLPGEGGQEVGKRISLLQPGVKILYMSGYTENAVHRMGIVKPEYQFIEKPFTPATFGRKVREVLDRREQ